MKYLKGNRMILVIAMVILIIGILYYNLNNTKKSKNERELKNVSNANRRILTADVLFFHADWCPHCVKAAPTWKGFVQKYDKKVINGYKVHCIGVDCSNANDSKTNEIRKKYKVNTFPTIKLIKDGKTINYDAKIIPENLTKFINSVLV
jgi:thiol-disulfide isomerase/thioredoxin